MVLTVYTQSLHNIHTIPQGHRWSLLVTDHHHLHPVDQSKCEQPTYNITFTSIIMMKCIDVCTMLYQLLLSALHTLHSITAST